MKKAIAWLTTGVLALSLTACGGPAPSESQGTASEGAPSSAGETNMTVFWWGNQKRNELTQEALELYMEQNPGVTIDAQFAEWGDYWNKLATTSASHSMPDVIQMDYKYISQYVDNGLLLDLQPYVDSGMLDLSGVDESILASGSKDGGLYGLCIGVNSPALIYNKTLLEENGLEVKDNMTYDEFVELSKAVYEKTGVKTSVAYAVGENYIDYTIRAQGLELYDGNKFGVNSAEDFVPYFKIYEDGIAEGWMISPEVFAERAKGTIEQDPLVFGTTPDQRSWCMLTYSNQLSAMQAAADAEGIELGITTWPSQDPVKSNYLKPAMFFSISADCEDPEAAVKFLDYWTNSMECNEVLMAERGIPASSSTAEALTPKLDPLQQEVIRFINEVVTPNCSTISPAAPETSAQVLQLYDSLQEQVCYGQLTAEQAAQQLYEEGNAILAG